MHVLVLTIEWSYYVHGTNTIITVLYLPTRLYGVTSQKTNLNIRYHVSLKPHQERWHDKYDTVQRNSGVLEGTPNKSPAGDEQDYQVPESHQSIPWPRLKIGCILNTIDLLHWWAHSCTVLTFKIWSVQRYHPKTDKRRNSFFYGDFIKKKTW